MEQNLRIRKHLEAIPAEKGCTTSQLALAWLLNQGDDIVPISGTKRVKYLEENAAAANIMLTQDELQQIEEAVPAGAFSGARYLPSAMARVNRFPSRCPTFTRLHCASTWVSLWSKKSAAEAAEI